MGVAMTPHLLEERLIDFAVTIVSVVEALPDSKAGNHIANQLIRSGTSPAPNYGEAQSAESRKDFIHILPRIRICEIGRRDLIVPLFFAPQRRGDNKVAAP
jgi:hypothetical protein